MITILGKPYQIVRVESIHEDERIGECDVDNGCISILSGLNRDVYLETALHEIIHAVDKELLIGLTEEQVQRLGVSLYAVYKENAMDITFKPGGGL